MQRYDHIVVGGGFTGLTAAYALSKKGRRVLVLEADATPGGLAGTFAFADGVRLERFYHHWFNNDVYVPELARELDMADDVITMPSRTGVYFNGQSWKLSTPVDLLRFKPLSLFDRVRLGLLLFHVRRVKDWRTIEHLSIREWIEPLVGKNVFRIVWEPLISSKFSVYAESINAVWFWKKLVLRGGTRNKQGGEELAYFKGGFGRLAAALVEGIKHHGGEVSLGETAISAATDRKRVTSLTTCSRDVTAGSYLFTPAFPLIAKLFEGAADEIWLQKLRRVRYLGNMCLVLRLRRSLSDTYWLNVNDPGFPFVGVIEHTNFDSPANYAGTHIAYLSRYLAIEDPVWSYSDKQYFQFASGHLRRMFPEFDESWVLDHKIWRAEFAQPVTERNYSRYVPGSETPFENALIATMAQIYPEDRGTNYAIREGRAAAERLTQNLCRGKVFESCPAPEALRLHS